MDGFRDLLACPACAGALSADWIVRGCGARFDGARRDSQPAAARRQPHRGGAPLLRARAVPRVPVRATACTALRARAERSAFARLLDRAIPGDARIVEVGCGTGQMCLYLARADRVVVGADLDARVAPARRRGRAALRARPRAVRRDRSPAARA